MTASSPVGSIVFFVITTILYAVSRVQNGDKHTTEQEREGLTGLLTYFLGTLISQYLFNLSYGTEVCGAPQYFNTLVVTAFPWILIFGLTVVFVDLNPSWVSPFANSIGYALASGAGLKKLVTRIFKPLDGVSGNEEWSEALTYIYGNQSLLINQVTPQNFDNFWNTFSNSGLIREDLPEDARSKFLSLVELKDTGGLFTWYLLSGILAAVVSYNYIISSQCDVTSEELKRRHEEYSKVLAAKLDEKNKPTRLYTTVE